MILRFSVVQHWRYRTNLVVYWLYLLGCLYRQHFQKYADYVVMIEYHSKLFRHWLLERLKLIYRLFNVMVRIDWSDTINRNEIDFIFQGDQDPLVQLKWARLTEQAVNAMGFKQYKFKEYRHMQHSSCDQVNSTEKKMSTFYDRFFFDVFAIGNGWYHIIYRATFAKERLNVFLLDPTEKTIHTYHLMANFVIVCWNVSIVFPSCWLLIYRHSILLTRNFYQINKP